MDNQTNSDSLPTSLEELINTMAKIFTDESRQFGNNFQPKSSDIILGTFAKCGTTWIQQIAHGLRTRGDMDFDDITTVTPWISIAYNLGWDLEASQKAEPRVYKSHLNWHDIPKGCKYICSFRNPEDAFVSFYRFFEGRFFEAETISIESLSHLWAPRDKLFEQGYWHHLISWWEQRHNSDVLLLCYEDMKDDLEGTVRKISDFMAIELDDHLLSIVLKQSSREFMLANQDKFDNPDAMRKFTNEVAGLPYKTNTYKITSGNDKRYQLSSEQKQEFKDIWKEQIESKFGFKDYEELRQELKELQQSKNR